MHPLAKQCGGVQAAGMGFIKVLPFSRHKDFKSLQVYIDRVDDARGS